MNDSSQKRRRVLVTGAGRGIGRAVAIALADAGFHLVINYRANHEAAQATLAHIEAAGGSGQTLPFDVADRKAAVAALEADMDANGAFWGVVLNAGITADGPLPGMEGDEWDRVLRTNLDSFYNVLRPVIMPMIRARSGGRIITMSSLSGIAGNRGQTNYAASKGGLIAATKSLARELGKRRITVNSIAPGFIQTEMAGEIPDDIAQEMIKEIPLRRMGKPEEVGALAAFLFSEGAAYITGEVISINGGLL